MPFSLTAQQVSSCIENAHKQGNTIGTMQGNTIGTVQGNRIVGNTPPVKSMVSSMSRNIAT